MDNQQEDRQAPPRLSLWRTPLSLPSANKKKVAPVVETNKERTSKKKGDKGSLAPGRRACSVAFLVVVITPLLIGDAGNLTNASGRNAQVKQKKTNKLTTTTTGDNSPAKGPRQQPAQQSRLPNFLLAGAQKAGTTAIALYLMRQLNTDVCSGLDPQTNKSMKEVHFFNRRGKELVGVDDHDLPIDKYRSFFRHCSQQQPIVMDATPNYLSWADEIHRVYKQDGSEKALRILLMLREPVSRELSWFNHLLYHNMARDDDARENRFWRGIRVKDEEKSGKDNTTNTANLKFLTFQEFMETNRIPLMAEAGWRDAFSRYEQWIEPWLKLFDRGQIWIASYDELKTEPDGFLRKLRRFLNVTQPSATEKQVLPQSNAKNWPASLAKHLPPVPSCDVQKSFLRFFEPYNEQLYQLLANHSQGAPAVETQPFPRFQFRCREAW